MVDVNDAQDPEVGAVTRGWWSAFRSWPGPFRWVTYVVLALVLAMVAVLVVAAVAVRRPWPETEGELTVDGLQGSAEVIRDENGIPQIYADSLHDLMVAQGFVHAQERFFEMDVRRHATSGRLAELFGEGALETDLVVRTLGWRQVAERELQLLSPRTRDLLTAYAEGVNAYLADRPLSEISLEYTILDLAGLDYQPEEWTPVDSIAWLKAMAWDLRGNIDEELGRALATEAVGPERAAELYPGHDLSERRPIVEQGSIVDGEFDQNSVPDDEVLLQRPRLGGPDTTEALRAAREALDAVPHLLGDGDGIGSNSWVVGGQHTGSGAPILANDPHLGIALPGVWMQVGLHCREVTEDCPMDVAGFSFSGVPGVVIGHNADIAWGFTNLAPDVTDLYVERIDGDRWQHGKRFVDLEQRTERIEVRGEDAVEIVVRSTAHGPLLSDIGHEIGGVTAELGEQAADAGKVVDDSGAFEHGVSLAWTALRPQPTADALFGLNFATDWESFRRALADFAVPGQNVVYADRDGHIGYQATGQVPIRRSGHTGLLPVAGWIPGNDWTGEYVPYDALPRTYDPPSGVIVTANQTVIDPRAYPYQLTLDADYGYRAARISELLAADPSLSVDDMSRIQNDAFSALGPLLVPYLLELDPGSGYYRDGWNLLQEWNYEQGADSAAAAYFNVVWRDVLDRTFNDELTEELEPEGSDRWFAVLALLLEKPDDPWWDDVDTDQVETRDDILVASLRRARDELTARQSPDPADWSWGRLHRMELRSSTLGESGVGVIEMLFNRGHWEVAGGGSIVNATGWDATEGFEVTTSPSMRMVVPVDDWDAARWISLTGVSGHAFHPHYTDQTDLWARGETLPWTFSREAVEDAGVDVLVLEPE